jgi:hypothetical protein
MSLRAALYTAVRPPTQKNYSQYCPPETALIRSGNAKKFSIAGDFSEFLDDLKAISVGLNRQFGNITEKNIAQTVLSFGTH